MPCPDPLCLAAVLHKAFGKPGAAPPGEGGVLIPHKAFVKLFCKSLFPHKSVNLFSLLVIVKDGLTDLWGG